MSNHTELLQRLREGIRQVETAGRAALYDNRVLSGGVVALDQLLPDGGYAPGSIVEWLAPTTGCGAELLGLLLARAAAGGTPALPRGPLAKARAEAGSLDNATRQSSGRDPGVIVIADPARNFYPPAAFRLGLRPDQLILLQHPREEELYWAIEQALRCPAVAAVYAAADLGSSSRQSFFGNNLDPRWLRRFQLAAEQGGGLGIFVRPARVANRPTWADLQWRVSLDPLALSGNDSPLSDQRMPDARSHEATVPLQVQLLRCRGRTAGESIALQLNLQTGEVRRRGLATKPAAAKPSAANGVRLSAG
jgi:protein ImuA